MTDETETKTGRPDPKLVSVTERDRQREAQRSERRRVLEARMHPRLLKAILENPSPSALLLGPSGTGKTAGAQLIEALAGIRLHWCDAEDLLTAEKRYQLGKGEAPEVEDAITCEHLLLDDIGSTPDVGRVMWRVINARYRASKSTIVTSGLTQKEFVACVGGSFVRRVIEQHAGYETLAVDLHA